jgi:hypothetical protein
MSYILAIVVLLVIVLALFAANAALRRRVTARHDSIEDAMSDEREPLPSAHLIPDNTTPAGDTPEAHDELNPHDLPPDHPGREAAEEQAGGEEGTTRGHEDPSEVRSDRR